MARSQVGPIKATLKRCFGGFQVTVALALAACGAGSSGPAEGGAGLAWSLAHHPVVQVECYPESLGSTPAVNAAIERLRAEGALEVLAPSAQANSAASVARLRMGLASDPYMREQLTALGVEIRETAWVLQGIGIPLERAWVVATKRSSTGTGQPDTLLIAASEEALKIGLRLVRAGTWPSVRAYSGGFPVLQADLADGGRVIAASVSDCRPWFLDGGLYAQSRERRHGRFRINEQSSCDPRDVDAYVEAVEATWSRIQAWCGEGTLAPQAPRLYAQTASHHWARGEAPDGWCQVDTFSDSLQVLILPGSLGDGGARAGAVYLEELLGDSPNPWLAEALGVQASGVYWGQDLTSWWRVLARLPELPPPSQWIAPNGLDRMSPHLAVPLRALLVHLIWEQEPSALLELWKTPSAAGAWQPWLAQLGDRLGDRLGELAMQGDSTPLPELGPDTQIGVALEGGLDPDALWLGSDRHFEVQDRLRAEGAEALAYRLYLCSEPHAPLVRALPWRRAPRLGDVRGEALLAISLRRASSLSLHTALSLEVWARPSGVPMQDVVWPAADRFEAFFGGYEQATLHAVLLARLCGVEWLNLGDGMGEIMRTLPRSDEMGDLARREWIGFRQARWQQLLTRLRPVASSRLSLGVPHSKAMETTDVGLYLDAIVCPLRVSAQDIALAGGQTDNGIEVTWRAALANIVKAASDQPVVVWPIGISMDNALPGAHAGLGVVDFAERLPRVWELLGKVLGQAEGPRPVLGIVGPLDLLGEALPPGETGGRLGRWTATKLLQSSRN